MKPRSMPARLAEIKNVKDFGAAGDGMTNDSAAVERAKAAGDIIYFPPGTYKVDTIPQISTGCNECRLMSW